MGTAPWANVNFAINNIILNRLTASHLHLITGKDEFLNAPKAKLYNAISPKINLQDAQNLIWITNRQNGKTSTIGRFIAALAIASPVGGMLCTIYSTSLDRSVELKKSAMTYLHWMTTKGRHHEWPLLKLVMCNFTTFAVQNGDGSPINSVIARPKSADSCRGDAPEAAFFDEIGFMSESMWYSFAYPLLQVGNRTFTCCTTPPPTDSFFDVFVKQVQARNKQNDFFFYLENHSLACPRCIELQEPDKCAHRLYLVPPWKSMLRFARMKALVPSAHEKDFATEVYGVLGADSHYYIPKKDINRAEQLPRQFRDPGISATDNIYVAIDPASHEKSDMGIAAMVVTERGEKLFLGASSVHMEKCMVQECQIVIGAFLKHIRMHSFVEPTMPIVPIVECNNNEILARSLLESFKPYGPIFMPFVKGNFQTSISHGVGVWLTQTIKMAMIQTTYQAILDNTVRFSGQFVVTGRNAFDHRAPLVNYNDQIQLLLTQLGQFKDQPDGKISGKTAAGDNDDLGIAAMMCIYWSFLIRSLKI